MSGAITANKTQVDFFLRSGKDFIVLEQGFNRAVGRAIGRGQGTVDSVNKVRVVLVKDSSPLGYYVKTAFPIP